ncbi:hypothetical protein DIPPA_12275 [Diplonema papillatum]|nr:hypothetical protein DIPPA_12275 [Diplonema papillatum]
MPAAGWLDVCRRNKAGGVAKQRYWTRSDGDVLSFFKEAHGTRVAHIVLALVSSVSQAAGDPKLPEEVRRQGTLGIKLQASGDWVVLCPDNEAQLAVWERHLAEAVKLRKTAEQSSAESGAGVARDGSSGMSRDVSSGISREGNPVASNGNNEAGAEPQRSPRRAFGTRRESLHGAPPPIDTSSGPKQSPARVAEQHNGTSSLRSPRSSANLHGAPAPIDASGGLKQGVAVVGDGMARVAEQNGKSVPTSLRSPRLSANVYTAPATPPPVDSAGTSGRCLTPRSPRDTQTLPKDATRPLGATASPSPPRAADALPSRRPSPQCNATTASSATPSPNHSLPTLRKTPPFHPSDASIPPPHHHDPQSVPLSVEKTPPLKPSSRRVSPQREGSAAAGRPSSVVVSALTNIRKTSFSFESAHAQNQQHAAAVHSHHKVPALPTPPASWPRHVYTFKQPISPRDLGDTVDKLSSRADTLRRSVSEATTTTTNYAGLQCKFGVSEGDLRATSVRWAEAAGAERRSDDTELLALLKQYKVLLRSKVTREGLADLTEAEKRVFDVRFGGDEKVREATKELEGKLERQQDEQRRLLVEFEKLCDARDELQTEARVLKDRCDHLENDASAVAAEVRRLRHSLELAKEREIEYERLLNQTKSEHTSSLAASAETIVSLRAEIVDHCIGPSPSSLTAAPPKTADSPLPKSSIPPHPRSRSLSPSLKSSLKPASEPAQRHAPPSAQAHPRRDPPFQTTAAPTPLPHLSSNQSPSPRRPARNPRHAHINAAPAAGPGPATSSWGDDSIDIEPRPTLPPTPTPVAGAPPRAADTPPAVLDEAGLSSSDAILRCHVCGNLVNASGMPAHVPKCLKAWHATQKTLPQPLKHLRPPMAPSVSTSAHAEYNREAQEIYLAHSKNRCPHCLQRFDGNILIEHVNDCSARKP